VTSLDVGRGLSIGLVTNTFGGRGCKSMVLIWRVSVLAWNKTYTYYLGRRDGAVFMRFLSHLAQAKSSESLNTGLA